MKTTAEERDEWRTPESWDNAPPVRGAARTALLLYDIDEAIRERDEARGDFDGLMDAIELSGKRRHAEIAGYWRRINAVELQVAGLLDSVRARDQAISDAAAVCAQLRGALAKAEAERDEARLAAEEASSALGSMAREYSAAALERNEARALAEERHVAATAMNADVHELASTLEAVRAELLLVTGERDLARRSHESSAVELFKAWDHSDRLSDVITDLRRRLSEQGREKDPQRNATAGLLRVEQAAMQYLVQRCGEFMDERNAARAEVDRMRPVVAKVSAWRDLQDASPPVDESDDDPILNAEWELVVAFDQYVRQAPLDPDTGAAILRHLRVEKAIEAEAMKDARDEMADRVEADREWTHDGHRIMPQRLGECGKCSTVNLCFGGHYACVKRLP